MFVACDARPFVTLLPFARHAVHDATGRKVHRSVTTKILLPDMFFGRLTDIVFVRQDAKKEPRSTMALDRRWFFHVTAELRRQFSQHLITQIVRFCSFNTVVFSCFFSFRPNVPLVFFFLRNMWQD